MTTSESHIYPPYIIERSSRGERTYDIFSRLLMDRIVFLGTSINDDVANIIIAQLLFLDADNPERDADAKVRGELIEQIVQANNVVAPRPLVERALALYAQAYDVPQERWEQFAKEFRTIAESQVRRDLVLDYVVESQNLRATEEDLDQKIQELAERRGMKAGELYASLEKAKRLRDVARSITEEKVFTYLLSQSTVEQA